MNASPEHQRLLLDVADIDRRIAQAERARTQPPQAARISELTVARQEQLRELTTLTGAREDTRVELTRLESDVALVETRRTRNADRLATTTNAKDALALEQELASLAKRLSDLEDAELDVMARVEDADTAVAAQQALIDATTAEGAALSAEAKAGVTAAAGLGEQLRRDRAAVISPVDAALIAAYDRQAAKGTGAALLRRGTCEGCRMMLSSTHMNSIRQAAADSVMFCPECDCVLVRTEESGL